MPHFSNTAVKLLTIRAVFNSAGRKGLINSCEPGGGRAVPENCEERVRVCSDLLCAVDVPLCTGQSGQNGQYQCQTKIVNNF